MFEGMIRQPGQVANDVQSTLGLVLHHMGVPITKRLSMSKRLIDMSGRAYTFSVVDRPSLLPSEYNTSASSSKYD